MKAERGDKQPGFALTYLSLGAGVQSTALYLMTTLQLNGCPKSDVAIFADTQDEPEWVYENLDRLEVWGLMNGGPRILRCSLGKMSQHMIDRHRGLRSRSAAIPAFTMGTDGREAMLRRQCTREYKIDPIEQGVRWLVGARWGRPVPKGTRVRGLLGISIDEAVRMKPSRTAWITSAWPLIDAGMRRKDCEALIAEHGLPIPPYPPPKVRIVSHGIHDDRAIIHTPKGETFTVIIADMERALTNAGNHR